MPWCPRPRWSALLVLAAMVLTSCTDDTATAPDTTSTTAATESSTASPAGTPTSEHPAPDHSVPDGGGGATSGAGSVPPGDDVVVGTIVDGDTFRTRADERVRLLNVDTPEPTQRECWSAEATQRLHELVPPGTAVRLVYDRDRYDRYGRTLAHVYRLDDGLWVNKQLVVDGAATAYVLAPNDTHYDEIRSAADEAARDGRGLWGACADTGPGFAGRGAGGSSGAGGDDRTGCDPAYPTVCIPPPPPDLDCADITARRFVVLPPDPHRFDGGGDGIGCERD